MKCGLLGHKLGHSYSPVIHGQLASYDYSIFDVAPEELDAFLRAGDFTGINVTIPYKKSVLPYCSELTDRAKKLGAVNTIVRTPDGRLIGHNSDYYGFSYMLAKSGLQVAGKKVLVLGSGGASNTVTCVLRESGANVVVISRSGENNYSNLSRHTDASVIVNTTPVGMYPNTLVSPIDLNLFPELEGVLDVIYNPARTKLLLDAQERGLYTMNGLLMLVAQAKESAEWFSGAVIPDDTIEKIYCNLKNQMENTVLIGMPGSGKSTVGQQLSRILHKEFVDLDQAIVQYTGTPVPEIIETQGETKFREIESEVIKEYGKKSGLVIATGGGCVTRDENYLPLHQNGTIFWLKRDLTLLPTDGRPLSQAGKLAQMYAVREPLYERFSDIVIDNNGSIEETINSILKQEAQQ